MKIYGPRELNVFSTYPNPEKIYKFLKYFLNEKHLLTWIKDAWSTIFDVAFVENHMLNPLMSLLPDLSSYLKQLEEHIFVIKQKPKPQLTQPIPFNITQPTPRKILLPEPFPEKPVLKPIRKEISKSSSSIPNLVKKENAKPPKELQTAKKTPKRQTLNDLFQNQQLKLKLKKLSQSLCSKQDHL